MEKQLQNFLLKKLWDWYGVFALDTSNTRIFKFFLLVYLDTIQTVWAWCNIKLQEKHLLFLCFDLLCRFFGIFFLLPNPFFLPFVVVVDFIGTMKSKFLSFFFLSHIFYYCYKPLPLHWALTVLCGFPFFSFFLNFNFLNLLLLSTFIPLFSFPTVLFPLQLTFNYINLLHLPVFNFAYLLFLSFLSCQHNC